MSPKFRLLMQLSNVGWRMYAIQQHDDMPWWWSTTEKTKNLTVGNWIRRRDDGLMMADWEKDIKSKRPIIEYCTARHIKTSSDDGGSNPSKKKQFFLVLWEFLMDWLWHFYSSPTVDNSDCFVFADRSSRPSTSFLQLLRASNRTTENRILQRWDNGY